uniref:Restriction endonuclease n=1 Tax=Marseillevirus LCMAC101 TaxID=2506602 RepID=A0A481YSD4_9VIRU|nr:MAG: restriction endonuclease [Marseillevirus LCMAC101]
MERRRENFNQILDEWDHEKNGDPENYSSGSNKKVWWVCEENPCGCHRWEATIANRTGKDKQGCPYCSKRKLCPHNNLLAVRPILCEEWNYKMNPFSPENYPPSSNKKVWWKCKKENCGCHVWEASICDRTGKVKRGCPYCSNKKLCPHNNLLVTYPEICEEWDKKNLYSPEKYSPKSNKKVWWFCRKENPCGCHKWETTIANRTGSNKNGCPYCSNKKLCPHNNLLVTYPEICKEWHKKNPDPPEKYSPSANKKVWWICKNKKNLCGCHQWEATINNRTGADKTGCPYCEHRKLCSHNNLLTAYPELCKEWDKNNLDPPEKYSPGSNKKVWWICRKNPCGCHQWKATINNRTCKNKRGCPYCSNKKLCSHNNLLAMYPEICKEWNKKNLYPPEKYSPHSGKKVQWICKKDPNKFHNWKSSICSRTGKYKTGCPICNFSKGEIAIANYLTLHKIKFIPQKKFDGCVSRTHLPFDFYLPKYNTLIEFDGIQHFEDIDYFYEYQGETLKYRIYKDKLKLKFCLENKIILLRITYEEIDIIDNILDVVMNNHIEDLFLFDIKNELGEKTSLHYIDQFEEVCANRNYA